MPLPFCLISSDFLFILFPFGVHCLVYPVEVDVHSIHRTKLFYLIELRWI
jgi:hypothetical protein